MPKINGKYLDISDTKPYFKKVFTSKFGSLIDLDPYNKRGDMVLQIFKVVPKDEFDPFYKWRGDSAEEYVMINLYNSYPDLKWYGAMENLKNNYDMFEENKDFGGVLDFTYTKKISKLPCSLEIKSKNIKNYEKILKNGPDKVHIAQASLGAYLAKMNDYDILYVFFTDEQEQRIRQAKESIPFFDGELKTLSFHSTIDTQLLNEQMFDAIEYCKWCYERKLVPLKDISEETLKKLNLL